MRARVGLWVTLFAAMAAAMLPAAAALEGETAIWTENFPDCSDWSIASSMSCAGGKLVSDIPTVTFGPDIQGDGAVHSWGPTYRTAAGSTWDRTTYPKLKLNFTNINTGTPGGLDICTPSCTNVRIWDIVISNEVATGISDEPDAILIRRTENFVEGSLDLHQFEIYQSDEGTQTLVAAHNLGFDSGGVDVNFNFTIDPAADRYWINWSAPSASQSGAITSTWTDTGDGWETEATIYNVTLFTYQQNNQREPGDMLLDAMTVFGLADMNYTMEAAPAIQGIAQGGAGSATAYVNGTGGFTGDVAVASSNWETGITGSCSPSVVSATGTCALAINVAGSVALGSYNLTINGSSTDLGITKQASVEVQVVEPPPPPPPPPPHNPLKPDFANLTGELGTQFYDRSVGPSAIISWSWSFGDGYGSRRQHPFHSYACKGSYRVELHVEDANGEQANVSATVEIAEDRPLCGLIQRSEQGLTIVPGASVTIPTLFFGLLATVSASTLLFGIDFQWRGRELISRRARVGLLTVSVFFLLLQFGYLGFLEALVV